MKLFSVLAFRASLVHLNKTVKPATKVKTSKRITITSWNAETDFLYGPIIKKINPANGAKKTSENEKNENVEKLLKTKNKGTRKIQEKITNKSSLDSLSVTKATSGRQARKSEENVESIASKGSKTCSKNDDSSSTVEKAGKGRKIKIKTKPSITKNIVEDEEEDEEETDLYDYKEATPKEVELILAGKFPLTYPAFPENHKFKNQTINIENEVTEFDKILKVPLFNDSSQPVDRINWNNAAMPSVSLILKSTMSDDSKRILENWEKNMIASMGLDEFELYKKNLFKNGSCLHSCIQKFLEGQQNIDIPPSIEGYWTSVQHVLEEIEDTVALELPVQNTSLRYKGILDGISLYNGKLCITEWKTSKRLKSSLDKTFDNPLQLVAYLAAFNEQISQPDFIGYRDKIAKLNLNSNLIESCLLVITYEDGSKADVLRMSKEICGKYWLDWLQRLHRYWSTVYNRQ